jgi:hypothetical protein
MFKHPSSLAFSSCLYLCLGLAFLVVHDVLSAIIALFSPSIFATPQASSFQLLLVIF